MISLWKRVAGEKDFLIKCQSKKKKENLREEAVKKAEIGRPDNHIKSLLLNVYDGSSIL